MSESLAKEFECMERNALLSVIFI